MSGLYLLFLCLCLLGLLVRTIYELLKRAGRIDTENTTVFVVVFAGMVMMLSSWIFLGAFDPIRPPIPLIVRLAGLLLVILAAAMAILGLLGLRGLENIEGLVTDGIYSRLRHPMYTGFILWMAGWTVFHGAVVSLIVAFGCAADVLLWRWFEESDLRKKYGEAFSEYRKRTLF